MKYPVLVIATLTIPLLFGTKSFSASTAEEINSFCSDTITEAIDTFGRIFCTGYIFAIRDSLEQSGEICSYGAGLVGLENKLATYLEENPEAKEQPAVTVISKFLKESYTCEW